MNYKWTVLYVLSAVVVNAMFLLLPPFRVAGVTMTAGSFVVGATLILRDYSQARELGPKVLWATLAGTVITAVMSPGLALASGLAYGASEVIDYLCFTYAGGTFRRRVVLSSLVSAPVDSLVFMLAAGFFSWPGVVVMTASKFVALAFVAGRPTPSQERP